MRVARPDDADALARLAAERYLIGAEEFPAERDGLAERLALGAGEDHFVLLAEVAEEAGRTAGYLVAGGSRDEDAKGGAEIYELVLDPRDALLAGEALLSEALGLLEGAAYAEVTIWVGPERRAERGALLRAGFSPDGARHGADRRYRAPRPSDGRRE